MHIQKCIECGTDFKTYPSQKRTYCSTKCLRLGYSKRMSGEGNPNFRHGNRNCGKCGKKLSRNTKGDFCLECCPSATGSNNSFFGHKHSQESLEKMLRWKRASGKHHWAFGTKQSQQTKDKISAGAVLRWKTGTNEYRAKLIDGLSRGCQSQLQHKMTKPEKIVAKRLKHLGIRFQRNAPLYNKFFVDFLLDNDTIIEVFGDYWHANPLLFPAPSQTQVKQIGRDKSRLAYLKECGRTVLVFWEKDLKNDPSVVDRKLLTGKD